MNAKKQRNKNRRRASKLSEQAWEAADEGNLDLAAKIIRRAVERHPANPALWHDQGALLLSLNQDAKAVRSFQTAIELAPDFADAYAGLAAIRARQGRTAEAVTLQREAVRHAPESERHRDALAAYEALQMGGCSAVERSAGEMETPTNDRSEETSSEEQRKLAARIDGLDWPAIDDQLTAHGVAHLPELLDAEACATLRALFDDDRLFAKTVTMNRNRFGKGVYRYFAAPIPETVASIRVLLYPHVAPIVNRWQRLLEQDDLYPATWDEFRDHCAAAGQTTPSPLMLRYEAGGFNALHQDVRGEVFFPLQLVIVLSRRVDAGANDASDPNTFSGGEFLFCDQPERKQADRRAIPAGLGDAVLFCTRARLARVGDVYGLQPVKHGLNLITAGSRYAIGLPFHEFA